MARSAFGSGRRAVLPATYGGLPEEGVAHEVVGVHVYREFVQLAKAPGHFAGVGVEGDAADYEEAEADALPGLLGRLLDVLRADGAVLGAGAFTLPPSPGSRSSVRATLRRRKQCKQGHRLLQGSGSFPEALP